MDIKRMLKGSLGRYAEGRSGRIEGLKNGIDTIAKRIPEGMAALEKAERHYEGYNGYGTGWTGGT